MSKPVNIIVFPGDHIGPEITDATLQILRHVDSKSSLGLKLKLDDVGYAALDKRRHTIPDDTLERARAADGIILGPCDTFGYPPAVEGGVNPSARLRLALDLYANIRPSRTIKGVDGMSKKMNLVIVRENTEGFYADRNMFAGTGEYMPTPDVAIAMRKISAHASTRIARAACEIALKRARRLTIVSKADVMKMSDGLFVRLAREEAAKHPSLEVEHYLVDAMAAHLVRRPEDFDVLVTTNMFGDILSNQASEQAGGLGLAGSINAGDVAAMAQASHGSAPDIAGQDRANPCSLLFSTAMLLDWLGEKHGRADLRDAAALVDKCTLQALATPATRTADLGGKLGTRAFADVVCKNIG
jgi:isocitrate/isopropylmalate dehydrogenase